MQYFCNRPCVFLIKKLGVPASFYIKIVVYVYCHNFSRFIILYARNIYEMCKKIGLQSLKFELELHKL